MSAHKRNISLSEAGPSQPKRSRAIASAQKVLDRDTLEYQRALKIIEKHNSISQLPSSEPEADTSTFRGESLRALGDAQGRIQGIRSEV